MDIREARYILETVRPNRRVTTDCTEIGPNDYTVTLTLPGASTSFSTYEAWVAQSDLFLPKHADRPRVQHIDRTWPGPEKYTENDLAKYFKNFTWSGGMASNGEWKLFLHENVPAGLSDEDARIFLSSHFVAGHGLQIICCGPQKGSGYWPEPYQEQYILYCLNQLPKQLAEFRHALDQSLSMLSRAMGGTPIEEY